MTWASIPGYVGNYEVSDHGEVRGLTREDGQGRKWPGRVLKQKTHRAGYKTVNLWMNGSVSRHFVHRLVLLAFVGPCPEGMEGCHNDGDPANNSVLNLRWDTPRANQLDRVRHGRNQEANKTSCPRGHLLVSPNLAHAPLLRGARSCLACQRARTYAKKHGVDFVELSHQRYAALMKETSK